MKEIFNDNEQRIKDETEKLQILRLEREKLLYQVEKYDHDIAQKERKIQRCTTENKFILRNKLF